MSTPTTDHGPRVLLTWPPRCDFCNVSVADTVHSRFGSRELARRYSGVQGETTVTLSGSWAACDDCAPLVRARRWSALAVRVISAAMDAGLLPPDAEPVRVARLELRDLYRRQLAEALTGDETRVGGR
jgi:hypothetical protein